MNTQAIARRLDGVLLIFRSYEGIWMIDRVGAPANDRGDEEWIDLPEGFFGASAHNDCVYGDPSDDRRGCASGRRDEDSEEDSEEDSRDDSGEGSEKDCFEGATAVSVDELWGMSEDERRSFHSRQLRKLGLPERGGGARVIWSMIKDFQAFSP